MAENKIVLYVSAFAFITLLILLAIVFDILPIIGFGIVAIGLIILLVGLSKEDGGIIGIGAIVIIVGFVIIGVGVKGANTLEEMGIKRSINNLLS
jgi:hypothetical protein